MQTEALLRSYTQTIGRADPDGPWLGKRMAENRAPISGWCHFLEMRLGKTPTALNEYLLFKRDYGIDKLLIVSPNPFKTGWKIEAGAFGVDVPVEVFQSKTREDHRHFVDNHDEGILVVNYEALKYDKNAEILIDWCGDNTMIVFDESVLVKNPNSLTTKAAFLLADACKVKRVLTGQPTPQGVGDLFAQLRLVGFLKHVSFFSFRNRYAKMGGFKGKQIVGVKNEEQLREFLSDKCFIARRAVWAKNMEEPDYEAVALETTKRQAEAYAQMEKHLLIEIEEQAIEASHVAAKWSKLQQISSGFVYKDQKVFWVEDFEKTPKFKDLLMRLGMLSGKVLIMAHFSATIDALMKALHKHQPRLIAKKSLMTEHDRNIDEEKRIFNESPDHKLLIAQVKTVKYGHTLLGPPEAPCLTTIYFENSYSLDDRIQSLQRNQGFSQKGRVHVLDYWVTEADRRVVAALQRKEEVAAKILGYYKLNGRVDEATLEEALSSM